MLGKWKQQGGWDPEGPEAPVRKQEISIPDFRDQNSECAGIEHSCGKWVTEKAQKSQSPKSKNSLSRSIHPAAIQEKG